MNDSGIGLLFSSAMALGDKFRRGEGWYCRLDFDCRPAVEDSRGGAPFRVVRLIEIKSSRGKVAEAREQLNDRERFISTEAKILEPRAPQCVFFKYVALAADTEKIALSQAEEVDVIYL
jgi:hypothetical protein